ncbi:MAG: DUF4189 domain-containing protein [Candidatus Obscuribacterales bacterium]|nr:DUF4189 domain-containing protein [Candidatus Obscuribacterales bacterium]
MPTLIALLVLILSALPTLAWEQETYQQHLEKLERESEGDRNFYNQIWNLDRHASRFCAIAYSKTTYQWGYSWGKATRRQAEQEAIKRSESKDAEILCWSKGEWYCALADGPKSYGGSEGVTAADAKAKALKIANDIAPGARIVLLVGGNPPTVRIFK